MMRIFELLHNVLPIRFLRQQRNKSLLAPLSQVCYVILLVAVLGLFDQNLHRSETVVSSLKSFVVLYALGTSVLWRLVTKRVTSTNAENCTSRRKTNPIASLVKQPLKAGFVTLLGASLYHIIAILYGAPVASEIEETFLFSLLMSLLSLLPLYMACNTDIRTMTEAIFCQSFKQNDMFLKVTILQSYCTMAGAWAAAAVIPLDWDRDWQKWPIPCSIGAIIGTIIGHTLGCVQLYLSMPHIKLP